MSSNTNTIKKSLALAMGATFAATMSASPIANADSNPFGMSALSSGYMQVAENAPEGKCGGKMKQEGEGKCGEGKCGEGMMKAGEGKCGEGKKMVEGKCGEGKCGANKARKEGKCGEGKCGEGKMKGNDAE